MIFPWMMFEFGRKISRFFEYRWNLGLELSTFQTFKTNITTKKMPNCSGSTSGGCLQSSPVKMGSSRDLKALVFKLYSSKSKGLHGVPKSSLPPSQEKGAPLLTPLAPCRTNIRVRTSSRSRTLSRNRASSCALSP